MKEIRSLSLWCNTVTDAGWHYKKEQIHWTVAFLGCFEVGEQVTCIRVSWYLTGDIGGKVLPMSQLLAGYPSESYPDSDHTVTS